MDENYRFAPSETMRARFLRWTRRRLTELGVDRGAYRVLWPSERCAYLRHLGRLDRESRRQRFHRFMPDKALATHARRVFDDPNIRVIGWFYRGVLRGAAEVAIIPTTGEAVLAESAFAVEKEYRRRGVGAGLMRRAALAARNRRARSMVVSTTWQNRAMLRLAMASGARFETGMADAEGALATGKRSVYSLCLETVNEEVGLVAWSWDRIGLRLRRLIERLRPRRRRAALAR